MKEIEEKKEWNQGETNLFDDGIVPNELFKERNSFYMEKARIVDVHDEGKLAMDNFSAFNPKSLADFGKSLSKYDDFNKVKLQ